MTLSLRFAAAKESYARLLTYWGDIVRKHAVLILGVVSLITAGAAYYTVHNFSITTSTSAMLSEDLPFRKAEQAMWGAFPHTVRALVIVIDGQNPDAVDDKGKALAERLRQQPELFKTVFDPVGLEFFAQNGLLYLSPQKLDELLTKMADSQALLGSLMDDPSLRGLFNLLAEALKAAQEGNDRTEDFRPVIADIVKIMQAQAQGRPETLAWRTAMARGKVEKDDLRRFVIVQPVSDFSSFSPAGDAMDKVREEGKALGITSENGMSLRLTGNVALNDEELKSVSQNMTSSSLLSLLLVAVLQIMGLGSLRLVLASQVTLLVGLILTAFFGVAVIGHFNMISVAFAVLFVGLGEDFAIHLALRYREERLRGLDHKKSLAETIHSSASSLTLCAITAAIGFFAFAPTDYRGVSELGIIAGAGMFIALIVSFTLMPAVLTLVPLKLRTEPEKLSIGSRFGISVHNWLAFRPRFVVAGAGILALASLVALPFVRFDPDPLNLKDQTTESVRTIRELLADSSASNLTINILRNNLDEAEALAKQLRALPQVDRAVTLNNYVPTNQEEKLDMIAGASLFMQPILTRTPKPAPNAAEITIALEKLKTNLAALLATSRATKFPEMQALYNELQKLQPSQQNFEDLQQRLLGSLPPRIAALRKALTAEPVTLKNIPTQLSERMIGTNGSAQVEVYPKADIGDHDAMLDFVRAVQQIAPDASGGPIAIIEAGRTVIKSVITAISIALVLITVVLLLLLGSIRDTVLVLAPIILAALLTAASTVAIGIPLNFANIIVVPLLLGLGVASSIHFVSRQREEGVDGIVLATSTPRAVLYSTLTTIASFGTLGLSSHAGTASMGILLTISISMTLVCTLLVLPALMAVAYAPQKQ